MPKVINAFLKRKPVMILAAISAICYCVYCISDFASIARNNHAQGVLRDMNTIMADVQKLPPGIMRAEELVQRLKAVDPGLAPSDCKQALRDYIAALDGSINAMKAGRDTSQYDAPMADAKQRLADCFRKYQ